MKYQPPVGGAADDPYVDGNRATGTEGSIPPAASIEHPMREIVHVLEQMGLTPDGSNLTQLYEAVSRASGRKVTTVTAADSPKALTVAEAGLVLVDASGGAVDLTLPASANNAGLRYTIARTDSSANSVTVTPDGTDTIEGAASISLDVSRRAVLAADGGADWKSPVLIATDAEAQSFDAGRLLDGAALAAAFGGGNGSLSITGYQKLPGGLILQWGWDIAHGADFTVSWAVAFPNVVCGAFAQVNEYNGGTAVIQRLGSLNTSQGTLVANMSGASSYSFSWFAIGY